MAKAKRPRTGNWGGKRPGAGRKPNPAKRTVAEGIDNPEVQAEVAAKADKANPAKSKKAVEVLEETMMFFRGLAVHHQPLPTNPNANAKLFNEYIRLAGNYASKLAPFQSPTFASVRMQQVPLDLSRLTNEELNDLERLHAKAALPGGDSAGADATYH